MGGVVDLGQWRREHRSHDDEHARLERAIDRLDAAIRGRGWKEPPAWLLTELLAIQGCLALGLPDEAAWRVERLAQKTERLPARRRAT